MTDQTEVPQEVNPYLGWLLAAKLAEWLGMQVGFLVMAYAALEEDIPGWLYINLPSGAILKEIPYKFIEGKWKGITSHEDLKETNESDSPQEFMEIIRDCLNGTLVHRHILIIPEEKEETE